MIDGFHKAGMHERLRAPVASLSSGHHRMIVLPNSRTCLDSALRVPSITTGTYIVHSDDDGKTWYVLDLVCVNKQWVRKVFPPYVGVPEIHAATFELLDRTK